MRISDWSSDVCSSDLFPALQSHFCVGGNDFRNRPESQGCRRDAPDWLAAAVGFRRFLRKRQAFPRAARGKTSSELRAPARWRSEEHTSERQALMRIYYAVFCSHNKKYSKNQIL